MIGLLLVVLVYIALGIGLIWLSMRLAKRIPFPALRIAIHTAVFTFWFMPGMAVGEGGAMPVPLWLIVLDPKQRLDPPLVIIVFGACWAIAWLVAFGLGRWWEKKQAVPRFRKNFP